MSEIRDLATTIDGLRKDMGAQAQRQSVLDTKMAFLLHEMKTMTTIVTDGNGREPLTVRVSSLERATKTLLGEATWAKQGIRSWQLILVSIFCSGLVGGIMAMVAGGTGR